MNPDTQGKTNKIDF